jgi:hypothetical protein
MYGKKEQDSILLWLAILVILVNLALSCQTNILINRWVMQVPE